MRRDGRWLRRALCASALVVCVACGEPPTKELREAAAAITDAEAGGAAQYAADELKAARESVEQAQAAVTQRDFRLALTKALDGRDRAQTAAAQASAMMAEARSKADMAISDAITRWNAANATVQAAEAARTPTRTVAGAKEAVAHADSFLQEARTAWEKKEFAAALTSARDAMARLDAVADDLQQLSATQRRRR